VATSSRRRPYAPRVPRAERREQLLDAALRIITERGYAAVSIEAVARGVGVSRPVVYSTFSSLRGLLAALLRREERRSLAQLAAVIPSDAAGLDPDEATVRALGEFLETVRANPPTWRLILLPAEGTPEVVRQHVTRHRARVLEEVRALVATGLERRGGPVGLDVELVARSIIALGEEAGRLTLTDPERFPPGRLTEFATALLASVERSR
jgi:AcrR family transcriptional regulator